MTSIKKEIMELRQQFYVYDAEGNLEFGLPWFTEEQDLERLEQFLSQALTRIEEETMEKALWCQFCGDELICFGCEGIPGRTMEENRKLLLASLPPSEEKECICHCHKCSAPILCTPEEAGESCIHCHSPKKEKRGR